MAAPGEMEIELGAVEYLREGSERALFAPNVRLNYGFVPVWEAVLEGEFAHGLTAGTSGTRVVGNGAFLKGMLREGSLQEKPGPSIATEFGLRGARLSDHTAGEIRAGVTFAFGVTQGPDLLSGRTAPALRASR